MPEEAKSLLEQSPRLGWSTSRAAIHGQILYNPDSFASVLLAAIVDRYGLESVQWSPVGLREQVYLDFGKPLPDWQSNRLMAAISVLTSNDFYKRLPRFITICNLFEGNIFQPEDFYPADCLTMAWGVTEATLIEPPDGSLEYVFSESIRRYAQVMLDTEGIVDPPTALQWVAGQNWHPDFRAFSGMPQIFMAEYEVQSGRSEEINAIIQTRLGTWATQMSQLLSPERLAQAYA